MIAGIDTGIDPERVHIMCVDDWYDVMLKYNRDEHTNYFVLNPKDGGVWIVPGKSKPPDFLWIYDGYIPMFENGNYIGYGVIDGRNKMKAVVNLDPVAFPRTVPSEYIANVRVEGSPKRWKNLRLV